MFASIDLVKGSSERIWGKNKKIVFGWEFGFHTILGKEPLESVDHFVNSLLESFVLSLVELFHLLLELSSLLDKGLFLSSYGFVADLSFLDNVLLESIEFLLKEVCPPFTDNDEIIEEHVFSVIELVVSLLFVSVEDLNKWSSEVRVVDVIDGANGVVVEVDHDLSVLVELLEDLVFVLIKLTASLIISFLEDALELLDKEGLGSLEHASLGANNLLVIESVVLSDGCLVLEPFLALAFVELGGCIDDDLLELLELSEDLSLDLVVVILSLVSIELLGKVGNGSPEVVLLLLELVSNDLSGICGGTLDCSLVCHGFHFNALADEFDAISEGTGRHGQRSFSSKSLDGKFVLLSVLEGCHLCIDGCYEGFESSNELDNHELEFLRQSSENCEISNGRIDMETRWVVIVSMLLLTNLGKCSLQICDVVL